mmetsp:Transcript_95052/g.167872  ORF Transcript_95052/g.167872 Transcript_95052/m.167872 type:complete len:395 (-) Transcript_95052:35-1219(-)
MSSVHACLLLAFAPLAASSPLPVKELSKPFRNWSYYAGEHAGFVVPPDAGHFAGQTLTDTAVVYEKSPEDNLPGRWRMTYLFFNGTKGANGYEVALAVSDDLLHWTFNVGGNHGIVFQRSQVPGSYDYGGVTLGGMLWQDNALRSRRLLKKVNDKYFSLYGCYPSRAGYEAGNGGQGVASSSDGVVWQRLSLTTPVISGGSANKPRWENRVVYQPYLVEFNETMWDFYNAAGTNQYGHLAEESGVANLASKDFPGIDVTKNLSLWSLNPASPLISSGPPGSSDTNMASDPKVFWDELQKVWVMFYFGSGDATDGHADIMVAFSRDLIHWEKDEEPLYRAGGHPSGIDAQHAHKISIVYDENGTGYMYYTAVGPKGRGIALLTSKPKGTSSRLLV